MRKDIDIPEVTDVHVAAVREFSEEHRIGDWNAYLINAKDKPIETVLIVSKGFKGTKATSVLRHKLENLPAKSYAKIEFMEDKVLALNNEFWVTFFIDGVLYDRGFLFEEGSISEKCLVDLPVIKDDGILAE